MTIKQRPMGEMMKSRIQIAEEICEPIRKPGVQMKLYEGRINGKKFVRSANWWSLYRTRVDGKYFSRDLIRNRINSRANWSELEATSAPAGMKLFEVRAMLGNPNYEKTERASEAINSWLSRPAL